MFLIEEENAEKIIEMRTNSGWLMVVLFIISILGPKFSEILNKRK